MTLLGEVGDRHPRWSLFLRTQSPVMAVVLILSGVVVLFGVPITYPRWLSLGLVIIVLATAIALLLPWERYPQGAQAILAVADLVGITVVALAMYGEIGTVAALAVYPAVWLGIAAGRWGVVVGIVGMYVAALVPLLATPGQRSADQWAAAFVIPVVGSVVVAVGRVLTARYDRALDLLRAASAQRNAATAESERLGAVMQSFADEIDLGLVFLDERGESALYNQAVLRFGELARYDPETGAGSRVFAADQVTPLHPEDQPLQRVVRGETLEDFLYWVGPRGTQRALVANGRAVHRPDGSFAGSMLIVQDATDLLRAGRSREDALATLAHELRTPLTSIVGYTDLLSMDEMSDTAAGRVDVIARNAEHLLTLTSVFLDGLHRHAEVHRERLAMRDLVDATIDGLLTTPGFAEREVHIDVGDELTAVADREGMTAVLNNLLSNAVKFSRPCDRIDIVGGEDEHWVSLTVHNTGSRVDPEDMERIFDRFYRGANAQRDAVAGTGIGLSVSREIVAAHGGTLTAEEVADGAAFRVCLPRE